MKQMVVLFSTKLDLMLKHVVRDIRPGLRVAPIVILAPAIDKDIEAQQLEALDIEAQKLEAPKPNPSSHPS